MLLNKNYFQQPTLRVAQDLLGQFIFRKINNQILVGLITETEAYCGPNDLASHASKGRTPRTELMFGEAGQSYIYLIYGMYNCFNIVTEKKDYPAAVLIRSIEPIKGIDLMIKNRFNNKKSIIHPSSRERRDQNSPTANGPGKLCQALQIDKKLNGLKLCKENKLWLQDSNLKIKPSQIVKAKRIGIDYAGSYKDKPWRFYLKNNCHVSKID